MNTKTDKTETHIEVADPVERVVMFFDCKTAMPSDDMDMKEFLVECEIMKHKTITRAVRVAIFSSDDKCWLHIDDYCELCNVSKWAELPET